MNWFGRLASMPLSGDGFLQTSFQIDTTTNRPDDATIVLRAPQLLDMLDRAIRHLNPAACRAESDGHNPGVEIEEVTLRDY